ncbi:MAG: hypothetical protein K0S79_2061, partial [Nitrospira sp.]|nr:hypothetical protein [Nitrospira sp.]
MPGSGARFYPCPTLGDFSTHPTHRLLSNRLPGTHPLSRKVAGERTEGV